MFIYKNVIKRLLDVLLSFTAILVLFPLMLVVSIVIRIKMGSPVIFRQERIGVNGKSFTLLKFRSMINKSSSGGDSIGDQERVTKLGRFLRSSSLDELPSLINVLCGDLSLIGPRPLPVYYREWFNEYEWQRHKIRGGFVPCSILSGKVTQTWEEQFNADVEYVHNVSFVLDVKIFTCAVRIVFNRYKSGYGTFFRESLIDYKMSLNPKNSETAMVYEEEKA